MTELVYICTLRGLSPGSVIAGRYTVERMLGQGGIGIVHEVKDTSSGERFALKHLRQGTDTRAVRRFEREARALAEVRHPNIVAIHEVVQTEQGAALVMELLRGETLRRRAARGRLPTPECFEILSAVAGGLAAIHHAALVHRDLKPENIFLHRPESAQTTVKILDFGLVKPRDRSREAPTTGATTSHGTVLGTHGYMAPEQLIAARDVDHRADLWALGVISYELLTGSCPIVGSSEREIARRLLQDAIVPIAVLAPDLPEPVVRCITTLLSRDVESREVALPDLGALFRDHAAR